MSDMQNEIMLLKQRIDELETKLDVCCGDMEKATRKIQRFTRGHQSRKNTKIMKRGKQPNITDALLDMPKDVGDLITTQRKIDYTKGWTIIKEACAFPGENMGTYLGHSAEHHNPGILPSIFSAKAVSESSEGKIGGFDFVRRATLTLARGAGWVEREPEGRGPWPREHSPDELIRNIQLADGTAHHTLTDLYIAPGASIRLLREKEEEGFEIEYDPIDAPRASLKKKKKKKKKKTNNKK